MEFVYNNALRAMTSVSLFFTNKGYHPNITIYPKCDIASFQVSKTQEVDLNFSFLSITNKILTGCDTGAE